MSDRRKNKGKPTPVTRKVAGRKKGSSIEPNEGFAFGDYSDYSGSYDSGSSSSSYDSGSSSSGE